MGYKQPMRLLKKFKKINFDRLEFYIPSDTIDYMSIYMEKIGKYPKKIFLVENKKSEMNKKVFLK